MRHSEYRLIEESEWKTLLPINSAPKVLWTAQKACILDGRTYEKVPLLVGKMGRVIDAPTSWLISLTVAGAAPLTVEHNAYIIRIFWEYLGKKDWRDVDTAFLRQWCNHAAKKGGAKKAIGGGRNNQRRDAVLAFYLWAQEVRLTQGQIGATPEGGTPYPIRLVMSKDNKLVADFHMEAVRPPRLPVPDIKEMEQLYQRLTGPDEALSERNCRMADMAVKCGMRREEFLSIKTEQIPDIDVINDHLRREKPIYITVIGKGRKARNVPVLPELMKKLRDHIRGHRKTLLGRTTRRESGVFLSEKSGERLTGSWVSKFFTRALGGTIAYRLTLHRLRARYISLVVLMLARREMKTRGLNAIRADFILNAAADLMGHEDIETLRRYVDLSIELLRAESAGKLPQGDVLAVDHALLKEVDRQAAGANQGTHKPIPRKARKSSGPRK